MSPEEFAICLRNGIQAERIDLNNLDPTESSGLDAWKEFIMTVFADGDINQYNNIISWLKFLFTNRKNKIALVLGCCERNGYGENFFLNFIKHCVMKPRHVYRGEGLKSITGKFNDHLKYANLVIINNDAHESRRCFHNNMQVVSDMIRDEYMFIDERRSSCHHHESVNNYMFIGSERDSHIMDVHLSTLYKIMLNDTYCNNRRYFSDMAKHCNIDVGNAFYTYVVESENEGIDTPEDLASRMMNE